MIFMGVMLEKWPIKGQELLKYMHNVSWLPRECLVSYVKYLYQMWIYAEGVSMLVVNNFQCKQ